MDDVIKKVSTLRGERLCLYQQANYVKGARYDEMMDRAREILNEIEMLLVANDSPEGGRSC